ncbi:cytochrome c oxidase biogenesis protein Cmc1-like protein [Xylariaceae sp. FL0255]|nr:cytochrome c oxidase biogenesis protein Cmc1-like protein [Xylariaceae sp. FL0255]
MHPHLHTKDNLGCEEVMTALEECHARGFLWKSMGMCTETKNKVTLCLRAERLKRTAANREMARAKREKVKAAWSEIDDNS